MSEEPRPPWVEWGAASLPLPGQDESGDRVAVIAHARGSLIAAIDGLGHGPEAALAATLALDVLRETPDAPLTELVQRCHDALRRTRGVAMSLGAIDPRQAAVSWLGVGNVEGLLVRARARGARPPREALVSRPGVVGFRLPAALRCQVLPVARGDLLLFATDGIRASFVEGIDATEAPQALACDILACHRRADDDASVVVARYLGQERSGARVQVHHESDVAMARKAAREEACQAGLAATDTEALATAVSELAWNIVKHAGVGEIHFAGCDDGERHGVRVVASDTGPGMALPERALEDGFSTGGGLGLGLAGARRLVDAFDIASEPGKGTVVTLKKWVR